jgi:hypothetical protein
MLRHDPLLRSPIARLARVTQTVSDHRRSRPRHGSCGLDTIAKSEDNTLARRQCASVQAREADFLSSLIYVLVIAEVHSRPVGDGR